MTWPASFLLTQSPTIGLLVVVAGSHGMLAMMRLLFSLLAGWRLTPRAERPFHSFVSGSQRSPTLEQPTFARAQKVQRTFKIRGLKGVQFGPSFFFLM